MADDQTPDPVDAVALDEHMKDHAQVPEDVVVFNWAGKDVTKPRDVVCHAHQAGKHCCLDYFWNTIDTALKAQ